MEIIEKINTNQHSIKAALFDFDGTISTLRCGWEKVMESLMLEMISGSDDVSKQVLKEVRDYIDQSAGIQTIYQMQWLAERVRANDKIIGEKRNAWWYKKEYNKRLMKTVQKRKENIFKGIKNPKDYMIKGSVNILQALKEKGVRIFIASGTDEPDVKKEVEILGIKKYFEKISGSPIGEINCSKEAVLEMLVEKYGLKGPEVVVIGDGKIEIALARRVNALSLGIASDEKKGYGINQTKRKRLVKAGAHVIIGDYENINCTLKWLGFES